jgi:hypothetical protein
VSRSGCSCGQLCRSQQAEPVRSHKVQRDADMRLGVARRGDFVACLAAAKQAAAAATPTSTHLASWRLVRRSDELTRSQPSIGRPRMIAGSALLRATSAADRAGSTQAAGSDGHAAIDEECETAEHLLLGDIGPGDEKIANPLSQVLVVRHARIVAIAILPMPRRRTRSFVRRCAGISTSPDPASGC